MKINVSDPSEPKLWKPEWIPAKVFLDDKEVPCVFYADEEAGIVKTYWIEGVSHLGNVAVHTAGHTQAEFKGREVSCEPRDVLRETLRGKVRIELP